MSSYIGVDKKGGHGPRRLLTPLQAPTPVETEVHAALVDKIMGPSFACVAARSAFNRQGYRVGVYDEMATPEAAAAVCHDLYEFSHEFANAAPGSFNTFMAVFARARPAAEADFDKLLWRQLQAMHEVDARHFGWSNAVSSDADSAEFSFSIGGRAFFVVGLNPMASRVSRTTPWPVIVFNPHEQFERLREQGKYVGMQAAIRARDIALQGSINPNLADFGERSETRQYSGRAVTDEWRCPFRLNLTQASTTSIKRNAS